jgi:hypothetical protein
MTTVSEARDELVTAVGAVGAPVDPPACYVFSNGSDLKPLGGSGTEWSFRVTCAVGYPGDDAEASAALGELVAEKLAALWALAGWRVAGIGSDGVRQIAGGDQLTADISVTTAVHL